MKSQIFDMMCDVKASGVSRLWQYLESAIMELAALVSQTENDSLELKQKSSVLRARPQVNMFSVQTRAVGVHSTK